MYTVQTQFDSAKIKMEGISGTLFFTICKLCKFKNEKWLSRINFHVELYITNYNEAFYYLPVLRAAWPDNDLKRIVQINLKTIQEDIEIFSDRPNSCTLQKNFIFKHLYRFWKMNRPRTFQYYLIYTPTHTRKNIHTQVYTQTQTCVYERESD